MPNAPRDETLFSTDREYGTYFLSGCGSINIFIHERTLAYVLTASFVTSRINYRDTRAHSQRIVETIPSTLGHGSPGHVSRTPWTAYDTPVGRGASAHIPPGCTASACPVTVRGREPGFPLFPLSHVGLIVFLEILVRAL